MEETYKERLVKESNELMEKIKKLQDFLESDKSAGINPTQLKLLEIQIRTMRTYSYVLHLRLEFLDVSI